MPTKKTTARFKKGTTDHDGDGKMGGSARLLTVKVDDTVGNGEGGYFSKGDKFAPGVGCDVEGLKDRGFVE